MSDLWMMVQAFFGLGVLIVICGVALIAGGLLAAMPIAFFLGIARGWLDRKTPK